MPSLHNTQLFLVLFPHLLSLPPCSLCSVSDWMRSVSVLYALWTAPGQNLTIALQHTLPQQSHKVKLFLCCAFNTFSVALKGSWKRTGSYDTRCERYLSLMESIWRKYIFFSFFTVGLPKSKSFLMNTQSIFLLALKWKHTSLNDVYL